MIHPYEKPEEYAARHRAEAERTRNRRRRDIRLPEPIWVEVGGVRIENPLIEARAALAEYDRIRADVTGESGSWGYPSMRDDMNRAAGRCAEALRAIVAALDSRP